MGRWLIIAGAVLLALGLFAHLFPGLLSWFGRLPGDLRIGTGRTRIFVPVTSMLLLSLLLTVLLNLFRR